MRRGEEWLGEAFDSAFPSSSTILVAASVDVVAITVGGWLGSSSTCISGISPCWPGSGVPVGTSRPSAPSLSSSSSSSSSSPSSRIQPALGSLTSMGHRKFHFHGIGMSTGSTLSKLSGGLTLLPIAFSNLFFSSSQLHPKGS